ncbi:extracellular solute-binding protein [Streptomyces sp. PSKA28]|uniref:Extracellular solute-binding protein n=2 Tax=Streptomyces TaxID=1883 RepID=A0A7W0DUY9_9ACTN|nr:extracellular solute-binding protein [Streptomyces himalayensis subsp. himalayensis]
MVNTWEAPPSPREQNLLWQALNKALGIDLKLIIVPGGLHGQKIATTMASGEVPDLMMVRGFYPRVADFAVSESTDLTDHLSGDNILKYPNLANIPAYAWQEMGLMAGRIYGIPLVRPVTGTAILTNRDLFTKASGGAFAGDGWDADTYVDTCVELSDRKHFALGTYGGTAYNLGAHSLWHGAPNGYALEGDKLIKAEATNEYRQALEFTRDMFRRKVFHPDGLTTDITVMKTLFYNGTVRSMPDGFPAYAAAVPAIKGTFEIDLMHAPTGLGKGPGTAVGNTLYGYTLIKKTSKARTELLLRVLDFLAAPFGSEEYQLINFGLEGKHFERDKNGDLKLLDLATRENGNTLPVKYLAAPPTVSYIPGDPGAVRRVHAYQTKDLKIGKKNPMAGFRSTYSDRNSAALNTPLADTAVAVIEGRKPMADWDKAVQRWHRDGGNRILDELLAEYEAVNAG